MVPESPSVCFRCKMCKVCFLTMNEIERHLKATNHYIRPSSNNSNSTKENSIANESSDEKPLNLSSKSTFPPLPTPSRPDEIDLTLSSEDSESEDDKNATGRNALKDSVKLKEEKSTDKPKVISSTRKESEEADSPLTDNSVCTKSATQEDLADIETDTVSSTSSEPPPPSEKNIESPPPSETREVEASTQFPPLDEEEEEETQRISSQDCGNDEHKSGTVTPDTSMEVDVGKEDIFTTNECDDQEMENSPMLTDKKEESTATQSSQPLTNVLEEKAKNENQGESRINEDCEMATNENDEPEPRNNGVGEQEKKLKPSTESHGKKKKQKHKYRCKHCGDMFTFPVQVHMHMRKVHPSVATGESTKPTRRSSVNSPANNGDAAKPNVQMYPLRSLYARAKRRTRSMQSDGGGGGGGGTRRNSLGQNHHNNNNNEEKKEKKSTTARKVISFTCKHCGKKFPLLNQLKIHLHKVHPEKVKKGDGNVNGGLRKRKHLTSKRLVLASKRRQRQTAPLTVQTQNRSLRVSTRSASRSAESEPETVRMSTRRRSSVARSEKSCVGSTTSSRRSSTRREQEMRGVVAVKIEPKVDLEEEKVVQAEKTRGKMRRGSTKKRSVEESEPQSTEEENLGEKADVVKVESAAMQVDENEEDTIYNDSDCMIIDTVETILYALTSKRSQTCPNCNKYCKFAGNFKLHLKACMNLDDDLEQRTDDDGGNNQQKANSVKEEGVEKEVEEEAEEDEMEDGGAEEDEMEDGGAEEDEMEDGGAEEEEEEMADGGAEDEEEECENNSENEEGDESSVPYYQKLDYRRCWECGFVVSKFHNLSRHLKQRHNISMGTKEMHAKQAEILASK